MICVPFGRILFSSSAIPLNLQHRQITLLNWSLIDVLTIRPRVASLHLQVFARALHPELFQVFRSYCVERENYRAKIDITRDGHVVTFSSDSVTMSEVTCATSQPLPQKRRLFHSLLGDRTEESLEAARGIRYRTEFEMECLSPEMFAMIQTQLSTRQKELDLLHVFDSSGRLAMGAISFIHVETRPKSLTVQALHTFPDDEAIVKVFTTYSLPSKRTS